MKSKLNILLLEDIPSDAMLIERELKKNGFLFNLSIVDNKEDFIDQLVNNLPDLILSDYSLPQYNGMEALLEVLKLPGYLPFIIVTGTINEETAADCIKAGASDYVTKERLVRLGSAVRGALDKKETILLRQKAEKALQESEEKFRHSFDFTNVGMCLLSLDGSFIQINRALCKILNFKKCNASEFRIFSFLDSAEKFRLGKIMKDLADGTSYSAEFEMRFSIPGSLLTWTLISISLVLDANHQPLYYIAHIQDITQSKLQIEKIRKLSASVEQSPVVVIITDKQGNIEYVNPKFEEITGYSPEECTGKNPRFLKSGEMSEENYRHLWNLILSGKIWKGEFHNRKKDGTLYWESASISPIKDHKGNTTHFVSVKEDITRRKQMEMDLIRAKEKAEESDKLKSSFLATMSHEIRTPLNAIMGFSGLLRDNPDSSEHDRHHGEIIFDNGTKLLGIINDLFDISIIETDALSLMREKFKISPLLSTLASDYSSEQKVTEGAIRLITRMPPSAAQDSMIGDTEKIHKIFSKLIQNAFKFTQTGTIEFGYSGETRSKLSEYVTFFVRDTGVGIKKDIHKTIFERFRQGNETFTREFGGTGLGLAICSRLLQFMKGEIWVESEPDAGSVFYFKIPVEAEEVEEINKKRMPVKSVNQSKATVLIVDDFPVNLELIADFLTDFDCTCFSAKNGKKAIEIFHRHPEINLVLLDVELPDMSGFEVMRELHHMNPELIIIAQTAYAMEGDKEKLKQAGFDDYIEKPLHHDTFVEKMRTFGLS